MNTHTFTILCAILATNLSVAQTAAVDTSHTLKTNKLALNLDGARHAYHPNNEGLLYNRNGGIKKQEAIENKFRKGRGYGIAKRYVKRGNYYVGYLQPDGYFVSQTTTYNRNQPESSAERYADAETIPYITLSPGWKAKGIKNCDIAYVVNLDNGKKIAAIFADARKNDDKVEISLALAQALEIPVSKRQSTSYDNLKTVTRYVGIESKRLKIYYFPGSGDGNGKTVEEIQALGQKLMGNSKQ